MKERIIKIKEELDNLNDKIAVKMFKSLNGYEIDLDIGYFCKKEFNKLNNEINNFLIKYINNNEIVGDSYSKHKFSIFGSEYYRCVSIIIKDKKKSGYKK